MIGYLKGPLLQVDSGRWLVLAGSGVGYDVHVPFAAAYLATPVGTEVELWVHTHVREDALDLFGFRAQAERQLFLTCLNVSGIGPKGALGLISHLEPENFVRAILEGDLATLVALPGVGKKTAERLILELRDPLTKRAKLEGTTAAPAATAAKASGPAVHAPREVREALQGLGYRDLEIAGMLERAEKDLQGRALSSEQWIRAALGQRMAL